MASESDLSVDQAKQRKSLRSWFKTVKRKKRKTEESLNQEPKSRNVLQRMKIHLVKRFSKSTTTKRIQVNELYESADTETTSQEPKNEAAGSDNFSRHYKNHLEEKWLKIDQPNELMFKTSVEMLR